MQRLSRRDLIQGLGAVPLAAGALLGGVTRAATPASPAVMLPDKASFSFAGTHLNAAYTHPVGRPARQALETYIQSRANDAARSWPEQNARDEAVALYAKLIGANATDVAVVPSTLEGENLVAASLGLGAGAGVVTDPFHYDASLLMYGELHKHGMPLALVTPRGNRIDYSDLEAAITPETRLVAVSLVASATGYMHDLKTVCDIAHRRGAMVYADIIQSVGAVPFDVRQTGIDFCCAGMYKWLMGDFGAAFLYVRPDRLPQLKRVQVGWRQIKDYHPHFAPLSSPDPVAGDYELGTETARVFEVSTPSWSALAAAVGALGYINDIGVERITAHREPLLRRLREELPKHGFTPLTPADAQGPSIVFARDGVGPRFQKALQDEKVFVTAYKNRIRISVSVYNDTHDVEKLIGILSA